MAAYPQDTFMAAVAAIVHYEIAAEYAAERPDVKGPGTFIPAFIDELYSRRIAAIEGKMVSMEELRAEALETVEDAGLLRKDWEEITY